MAEKINLDENQNEIVDEIKLESDINDNDSLSLDNEIKIEEEPLSESLEPTQEAEDLEEENFQNKEEKDISEYATEEDDLSDYKLQKKQTKLQKILTAVAAILLVVLTIGLILYFTGFFDKKKPKKEEPKIEQVVEKKKFDFKSRDIDSNELNKKFNNLTKYDPTLETQRMKEEAKRKAEEEAKKKEEAEAKRIQDIENLKKELEEQKKALEDRKNELVTQKEELLKIKQELLNEVERKKEELKNLVENKDQSQEKTTMPEEVTTNQETIKDKNIDTVNTMPEQTNHIIPSNSNSFLPLINVTVLNGELTKDYLQKIEKIDKKILLCRDNKNHIEIYVGPYEMPSARKDLLSKFLQNGFNKAMLVDLTKEEFNKRCNY